MRGDGKRAHRRDAIVDAAREMFGVGGYHGTRMEEISARAGISKPVLYSHFSDKLDLYLIVLQQYLDRMVDGIRFAVTTGATPKTRVSCAVSAYFDFVDEDRGGHVLVFESPVPSEPCVEVRVRSALRACADLLATELHAAGVATPAAAMYGWSLVGASHLAARMWLDAGRPIPKQDAVEVTLSLCWSGLSGLKDISG
ncbi:TetR/AcrR family transcriptional regulator [Nocardia salmonicida]|uniref:TetR/AcrR family transcriptional regulator n=1 Tax=Nocardia salmonicida TaxID=53431 RepID=UPI0033F5C3A0